MKAFISYSAILKDQLFITWLVNELNNLGIYSEGSSYSVHYDSEQRQITNYNIKSSDLFIGVIVGTGSQNENPRVYEEWNTAISFNKPRVFLVEDTVLLDSRFKEHAFVFNRMNPTSAIQEITAYSLKVDKDIRSRKNMIGMLGAAALIAVISKLEK